MTPNTLTDFEALRGAAFAVEHCEQSLTLATVAALPRSPREGGGFRLEFTGDPRSTIEQGVYRLTGAAAAFDVFIVPIARDDRATTFEAIFN